MANLLKGKDVSLKIFEELANDIAELKNNNIFPTLAILRVGEKENDLSYERSATKKCQEIGIEVKSIALKEDISKEDFYNELIKLNLDSNIHGILMLRPLPDHLDNELARKSITYKKDVDGCSDASLSGIFTNNKDCFAPCTAEAAVKILEYYNIEITGKNIVVVGRSLVIGKPVSMMLLNKNATVTICHSKSNNLKEITKKADIVICATGQMEMLDGSYFSSGQTVVDVGISWNNKKQKLCGDVLFEEVEQIVSNITPVPGGVGSVTTAILLKHVVQSAKSHDEKN